MCLQMSTNCSASSTRNTTFQNLIGQNAVIKIYNRVNPFTGFHYAIPTDQNKIFGITRWNNRFLCLSMDIDNILHIIANKAMYNKKYLKYI